MDHGAMDSASDHSSRASPVTGSPKHPHSPSAQQNQQQLHGSQHQPPPSHQQPHPRDQIREQQSQQQQHRGVPTPGSPTRGSPPQGLPLSPPPLSAGGAPGAPPGMVPRMPGLPPPGLGLLGQLGGMLSGHHGSPLELMAAHHAVLPPRSYNSPPPISTSDPTANECKLVDYRGQKVAAFIIAGDTMLCLPQAFELFLKHLVGGLHTVYTKLKRLDIVPLVCNVEQVRILRGLGAIQPGVNRCKLLSCKDFDILYRDCTTASSRPGRPPKRASVGLSLAASHLAAATGHHPQHSLKKHRMDNGDYYENGHLDVPRMEKSPLLANGYNHPPTHLSHMQFMQLGGHPGAGHTAILSPASLPHHLQAQAQARAEQGLKVNPNMSNMEALARLREERGDAERALALDQKPRDLSSHNGSSNGHSPVLNLSKTAGSGSVGEHSGSEAEASHRSQDDEEEDDNLSEDLDDDNEKDEDLSDVPENLPLPAPGSESPQALNYSQIASAAVAVSQGGQDPSVSSTETLLRNIQGLLKVAADNARQQERQINYEKAELKMDVLREREVKDSLERQLQDEQKVRVMYQKRLKKERRARKRLQEQLELEIKRRTQLEEALKATGASSEQVRAITENVTVEARTSSEPPEASPVHSQSQQQPSQQQSSQQPLQQQQQAQQYREAQVPRPSQQPSTPEKPAWGYGLDLIGSQASAFWQNYQESLVQELELERKSRQHQAAERDQVKSPLQESRTGYYKNSVLFTSAT
ncbi:dachshund homolog 2 isoform X3 [Bombus vosnesenskii]|uniref:Dachshund homolog 2 isoform X3 n=2 Tax=Pyrobombus TaxID=144703 RepID=A0A6J3KYF0_9HYME|nr:dachshund homolog 2 isoform X3 [Bombus vancouverensis nearcticus]XP_033312889.1 dachshund homolog 2 isoform X3 [Bombus bifarius]XP_033358408.1 dachshund homolog 2 isoform X3 [Bombus vosnesenskii]XP_050478011.1 dachshund homolog 2 isoform X3 [Bombus huntii]